MSTEPFETKHDRKTRQAEEIIRRGVESKRSGKYDEAKRLYEDAALLAPWYVHVYYALGKIHYLMGERTASLRNYTIAAHLSLGLGDAVDLDSDAAEMVERLLEGFPEHVLTYIRSIHPQATLLLCDNNTPRHLGHSLIDLQDQAKSLRNITEAAQAYKQSISGSFYAQLDMELEQGLYIPVGITYLLENIQWSKVGRYSASETNRLYTDCLEQSSSSAKYEEAEFRTVCDSLVNTVGFRPLHTTTPFADFLNELRSIWLQASDSKRRELATCAEQAFQAVRLLLNGSFSTTMGLSLLKSLNQSHAYQPLMEKRWTDTSRLLQTPVADLLFELEREQRNLGLNTPMFRSVMWCLRRNELRNMRNGFVHSCYSWDSGINGPEILIRERDTDRIVQKLDAETCEAFHSLICICASVLDRFLHQVENIV